MNSEENRLRTFNEWPLNAPVSPQKIAKAGFYATKQSASEAQCFSCNLKINTWNYGDQVMLRHRQLSPQCVFVLNPAESRNIPIHTCDYESEQVRLNTFVNWPVPDIVSPARLARAGFYYLKQGDNTKCAYCKGIVRAWEPGDDPDIEHEKHFPQCPFVINVIRPRLVTTLTNTSNVSLVNDIDGNSSLDELGVQKHRGPKRSHFGTFERRLRSFTEWPTELIQTPDALAQAGFYYEGMGDQVRCFHCDGGLNHWDPHDDPWTEHARWFPNCAFIKLVKGQEFVAACAVESQTVNNPSTIEKTRTELRHTVSEQDVQTHLNSPAAITALNIGINVERVKKAIRYKLIRTGSSYHEADALVEAALNLQLDEDDNFDSSSSSDNILNNPSRLVNKTNQECVVARASSSSSSGVGILAKDTFTSSMIHKPQKEEEDEDDDEKSVSLEEENRQLKEARMCKICMDGELGIVFLPCGHLATCVNCAPNLEHCPVCRSEIKATVRTFLS